MKSFFKNVLQHVVAQVIVGILLMGFAFVMMVSIIATIGMPETTVPKSAVLVFNLNTSITDSPSQSDAQDLIADALSEGNSSKLYLHKVVSTLRTAAKDKRIKGLLLQGNIRTVDGSSSYAAIREILTAIEEFKKTGKPVHAHVMSPDLRTYCLLSSANRLAMNPFGDLTLNGLSAEIPFYGTALKKLGVGIQPVRTGKYKSAIEPYTSKSFSEEARTQMQDLFDHRWKSILGQISNAREIEESQLFGLLEEKFHFSPEEALNAGLVDDVATTQEVVKKLIKVSSKDSDTGSFTQINLSEYAESHEVKESANSSADVVAVLYVEGVIVDGESMQGYSGSSTFRRQIAKLRERDDVKAVVLRVNSPGGSASASEVIRQSILDFQSTNRPLVVSMGGMAASGGYWVSAPAQRIIAQPDTVTGSIGVYGMLIDLASLSGKLGLTFDTISSGEHINPYAVSRPKNDDEIAFVQEIVDEIYEDFLTNVAAHRGMERDAVHEIAQGRVWTGNQALENGLVDEIGGLEEAIETAADLAGIGDFQLEHHPEEKTSLEVIAEMLGEDLAHQRKLSLIEAQIHAMQNELKKLRAWNDPRNIYARLPYSIF